MKYNTHRYIVETAPQYTNDWAPTAYSNDFDTALNDAREATYNDQCARIYDMFADRLIEF